MKKVFPFLFSLLFFLSGCSAFKETDSPILDSIILSNDFVEFNGYPDKLEYEKMWYYSAHGETENPEFIKDVVDLLLSFQLGEETDSEVIDFTDFIRFTYKDGRTVLIEIEEYNLVYQGKRYKIAGDVSRLRELLGRLVD